MKTFRATLNLYLTANLLIIILAVAFSVPQIFAPHREALAATLGIPPQFLWIVIAGLALGVVVLLTARLHARFSNPIRSISEQCANGHLETTFRDTPTRELRIIREYVKRCQEKAERLTFQIEQMEVDLATTREKRARASEKITELEGLVANLSRIRKELNYDNTVLQQESRGQAAEIRSLRARIANEKSKQDLPSWASSPHE